MNFDEVMDTVNLWVDEEGAEKRFYKPVISKFSTGEVLKQIRLHIGLTQRKMAQKSDLSQTIISQAERMPGPVATHVIDTYMKLLNKKYTVDDFYKLLLLMNNLNLANISDFEGLDHENIQKVLMEFDSETSNKRKGKLIKSIENQLDNFSFSDLSEVSKYVQMLKLYNTHQLEERERQREYQELKMKRYKEEQQKKEADEKAYQEHRMRLYKEEQEKKGKP